MFCMLFFSNNSLCQAQIAPNSFRYPAEFENQQAVWFGWERNDTALQNTGAKIIRELQGKVQIKIAVASYDILESARKILEEKGVDLKLIEFNILPGDRFWIRDNGAIFLVNDEAQLCVADFQWSSYGYFDFLLKNRPEIDFNIKIVKNMMMNNDESILDQNMALITGSKLIKSKLVIEGGALETNGKGVLLQCEQVTLQRNPGWTKKQIEDEFRRTLNIKKVIWLKKGTVDDEIKFSPYRNYLFTGAGGHLDEFVRFADANTILLGWIDEEDKSKHPLNKVTHQRMEENLKILEKATDQDGKQFRIIKIPLPSIIELSMAESNEGNIYDTEVSNLFFTESDSSNKKMIKVATVSYLNFLLTNGMFINASYINRGTSIQYEERVKAIFKELFPDREHVWIDVFPLNRNGGGLHCITQSEPVNRQKIAD